ncbi:PREDICTED: protein DEHYDRATION-INDUCED 19 homolog 5-like [Prunus mume]|uniref:Protein DEHYDRATION-INDUCED 19 homolog 5-like n=1 Tax=Prunus mume TaxID=102107 RepID=A0ABM0PH87_PRUMU|nr:PREDICTED: protein DEHYDRATION-INDUCED 19 homolog 5-like [Prunus mume]
MTNYTEDEEDTEDENYEELVDQESDQLSSLNIKISEYEDYLYYLENLREQILKETEGISSESLGTGSFTLESKWECDASSLVIHEDNHMALEDSEGDDDAKSCFPCPFCYVDVEVPMLCNHLEEEHCFDFKNAVRAFLYQIFCCLEFEPDGCDVVGHFMVHHASSFKHRRKSQKTGLWTGSSAMLGKALLKNGRASAHESAPDPLLSPFICNISFSDPTGIPEDICSDINAPITSSLKSAKSSSPDEGCEKDKEERRQRAAFVQQLITSTVFLDL